MEQEKTLVQENKMGVMNENKLLITMALPLIISMLVQACYNIVDSIFVAMVSEDALTAVSLAFPIQTIMIALGVGISTGLGYGDNARAALITRGIAEIARLGVAMGCNIHTFAGLAGIGDLIVTATSMHSRNNRAGILIGKGKSPEQAVKEVGMVVEGINALPAAMELAAKYNVEMPIVQTVNAIVKEGMSASDALRTLMDRNRKNEMPQGYEKV